MWKSSPAAVLSRPATQIVLLVVSLSVCGLVRVWALSNARVISRDGVLYTHMARNLARTSFTLEKEDKIHPGYPAAIVVAHRLMGLDDSRPTDWDLSGQIVSVVAALATLGAVWLFARRAFNPAIAWMCVWFFVLAKPWIRIGSDVLSDSLAICLQLWTIVAALKILDEINRSRRRAVAWAAVAGVLMAAAYLVRLDSLYLAPLVVVTWLGGHAFQPRRHWALAWTSIAACLTAMILAALPYMWAIGGITRKKELKDFVDVSCSRGMHLLALSPQGDYSVLRHYVNMLFEAMHPLLAGLLLLWVLTRMSTLFRIRLPRQLSRTPSRPATLVMVATFLAVSVPLSLHFASTGQLSHRYLMAVGLLLYPLSAAELIAIAASLHMLLGRMWRRVPRVEVLAVLLTAGVLAALAAHGIRPLHQDKGYYRQAAGFLLAQTRPGLALADNHYVPRYAPDITKRIGGDQVAITHAFLYYVLRDSATWVVIRDHEVSEKNPELRQVLKPPAFAEVAAFRQNQPAGHDRPPDVIRIYRVDLLHVRDLWRKAKPK